MEELTNWPKKSGKYKIVQMELDGKPCVRFPMEHEFSHAYIIIELANSLERKYPTMVDKGGFKLPSVESDWYKISGAGKARVNADKKEASFYDESISYKIGIDQEHLECIKQLHPDWKISVE